MNNIKSIDILTKNNIKKHIKITETLNSTGNKINIKNKIKYKKYIFYFSYCLDNISIFLLSLT